MTDEEKKVLQEKHARLWNDGQPVPMLHELASRVICVAHARIEGTWSAYCDAVPGIRHRDEMEEVFRHGSKLRENIARALFPQFDGIPYAP